MGELSLYVQLRGDGGLWSQPAGPVEFTIAALAEGKIVWANRNVIEFTPIRPAPALLNEFDLIDQDGRVIVGRMQLTHRHEIDGTVGVVEFRPGSLTIEALFDRVRVDA